MGNARPGQEPITALTPGLGPLPPIPVTLGAALATDPTLIIARQPCGSCPANPCSIPSPDRDR